MEARSAQRRKGGGECRCGYRDDDGPVKNPATLAATAMQQEEQEQEQEQEAEGRDWGWEQRTSQRSVGPAIVSRLNGAYFTLVINILIE